MPPTFTSAAARVGTPDARAYTAEATAREAQERGVVLGIVGVCAVLGLAVVSFQVIQSTRIQSSQFALDKSLSAVSDKQTEFRSMMGRFATWPELRDRGLQLETQQSVTKWNADGSHWFMAVRDGKTGIVCQRTGEMFDNKRTNRRSSCSSS